MAEKMHSIRVVVGTFDGESFKRIKHAKIGGVSYRDKLTAVWFELLDLAGKSNANGYLIDNNGNPYQTYEDIASMIDRDEKELELCMGFYTAEKMVEIVEETYMVANFTKYQIYDNAERIRVQNRERQARLREKRRNNQLLINSSEKVMNNNGYKPEEVMHSDSNVTCNVMSRDMCITNIETDNVGDMRNVTSCDSNVTNSVMCKTPKKEKKVTKKKKDLVVKNNNINSTLGVRACAREKVTIEDIEKTAECEGWEHYPDGEVYVEIRNAVFALIDSGKVTLKDVSRDLVSEIFRSMYCGRERREIVDLPAYIFAIVKRKRQARQDG